MQLLWKMGGAEYLAGGSRDLERGLERLPSDSSSRSREHRKGVGQTTLPLQSEIQRLWKGGGVDYPASRGADPEFVERGWGRLPLQGQIQSLWKGGGEDYSSSPWVDLEIVESGGEDYPATPRGRSSDCGKGGAAEDYPASPGADPEFVEKGW
jgi:hypothetical protein